MKYNTIVYEKKQQISCITLNRPEVANAINGEMIAELREVCDKVNQDEDARVVIITGAGEKAFCCGVDLGEEEIKELLLYHNPAEAVRGIQCPVIAAINGDALGMGLALALGCDLRLASDKSLFGVPDVAQGYLLASGITQWLPRIVGKGKSPRDDSYRRAYYRPRGTPNRTSS